MDVDYMAGKFLGMGTRTPCIRATLQSMRGCINQARAEGQIDVGYANDLRARLRDVSGDGSQTEAEKFSHLRVVVESDAFLREIGDPVRTRPSPRFKAFEKHLWTPFKEMAVAEMERIEIEEAALEEAEVVIEVDEDDYEVSP